MKGRFVNFTDEANHFYRSPAWRHKREEILKRDHYECQDCRTRLKLASENGIPLTGWERYIHKAKCVHHIQELNVRPDLALSDDNLISLCHRCHDIRHNRYELYKDKYKKEPKQTLTEEKW